MISIIYEDNHLLVVEKPVNIPVQADRSQDKDCLTILKEDLKHRYQKPGNVYLGLVHRLDRPVGGVMVFAKTSKAASRLSDQLRKNEIKKIYQAVVCSSNLLPSATWIDYLMKDRRNNMVCTVQPTHPEGKKAILSYQYLNTKESLSLVEIQLETGRPHQIRVQFASHHAPLWGDQRYNSKSIVGQQIALWAVELQFKHPITKEICTFKSSPPNQFPWTLLKENLL